MDSMDGQDDRTQQTGGGIDTKIIARGNNMARMFLPGPFGRGFNPLGGGVGRKAVGTVVKFVVKGIARFAAPWVWAFFVSLLVSIITFLITMLSFFE